MIEKCDSMKNCEMLNEIRSDIDKFGAKYIDMLRRPSNIMNYGNKTSEGDKWVEWSEDIA